MTFFPQVLYLNVCILSQIVLPTAVQPNNNVTASAEVVAAASNMSTEEVQTNSLNVLSSSQVVRELTTFYFYHQIQNKIELNFFLPNFLFQEKPHSHLEQSEVGGKPRAASIRTTRSSKAGNNNEAHSVPPAAYVSSQQLQEKAANRRRQNAKETGGEIFVLYLL